MLIGLATSLGLQLECRPMALPAWERRLRRRLWWAIYTEDKWRSLVLRRPPYIKSDEWDVTDLDESDFRIDEDRTSLSSIANDPLRYAMLYAQQFQFFARLSRIAEDVQHAL